MWYIKLARWVMRRQFEKDNGFKIGYISNIAMLLYDRWGIKDYEKRNQVANEILRLIFW